MLEDLKCILNDDAAASRLLFAPIRSGYEVCHFATRFSPIEKQISMEPFWMEPLGLSTNIKCTL